jgi:hypothetical protein
MSNLSLSLEQAVRPQVVVPSPFARRNKLPANKIPTLIFPCILNNLARPGRSYAVVSADVMRYECVDAGEILTSHGMSNPSLSPDQAFTRGGTSGAGAS